MGEVQQLRQRVGKFQPTEMGHFRPALTGEVQGQGQNPQAQLFVADRYQLTADELPLLNWPRILARLRDYARVKGYHHLRLDPTTLREVLERGYYTLYADRAELENARNVEAAALIILRSYLDRFYRAKLREAQTQALLPGALRDEELPRAYTVTVPKDSSFLTELKALKDDLKRWRTTAPAPLPRLYIDPGLFILLYQPLVYEGLPKGVRVHPTPLVKGEKQFVETLRDFWQDYHSEYPDICLYLMRNASKSGLGFHHKTGFYPDFILWIESPIDWRVVFVEPHGMRNENLSDSPRIEVFTQLLPQLNERKEFKKAQIELDGYILTDTRQADIPGAEAFTLEQLAEEYHLLLETRGRDTNLRTLLGL